jgi:hypothetical protein
MLFYLIGIYIGYILVVDLKTNKNEKCRINI